MSGKNYRKFTYKPFILSADTPLMLIARIYFHVIPVPEQAAMRVKLGQIARERASAGSFGLRRRPGNQTIIQI